MLFYIFNYQLCYQINEASARDVGLLTPFFISDPGLVKA